MAALLHLDLVVFNGHHVEARHAVAGDLRVEPQIHGGACNGTLRDILGLEREDDVGDAVVVDVLVDHLFSRSEVLPLAGGVELVGAHAGAGRLLVAAQHFVAFGTEQREVDRAVAVGLDDIGEDLDLVGHEAGVFGLHDLEDMVTGLLVVVVQELRAFLTLESGGLLRHGGAVLHELGFLSLDELRAFGEFVAAQVVDGVVGGAEDAVRREVGTEVEHGGSACEVFLRRRGRIREGGALGGARERIESGTKTDWHGRPSVFQASVSVGSAVRL